jgi:type IX secretion system PorP/SprF family membrane protein
MKRYIKIVLLFMALAWVMSVDAQDVIYTQFYANPVYLNPALAGNKLSRRLTLNYRNQWPGANRGYVSYSATWDQYVKKISGGVALMVNTDVQGGGTYNTFSGSGIYSYRLAVSRFVTINAAIQAGYIQYKLDWSKLAFSDQIDVHTGSIEPTQENLPPKLNIGNVDFSAGLVGGFRESIYAGVAVNHLSRPDMAFYEGNSNRLNLRYTVHAGMIIDFLQGMQGKDIKNYSISPNIVYVQQGKFQQLNLGMVVNKYPLTTGLWFRHSFGNPDAIIVLLGFQLKYWKVGYSFDYTISHLTIRSGGAHEISIAWLFPKWLDPNRFHELKVTGF